MKTFMPKATAVWMLENTSLTFEQIAYFTDLQLMEIQSLADGEVEAHIRGVSPIDNGQLTLEEIQRCQMSSSSRLQHAKGESATLMNMGRKRRYVPISKRADKPNAIAWLLKHHPELLDSQITRLLSTTRHTINAIRDKTHRASARLQPASPVELGLCRSEELDLELNKAARTTGEKNHGAEPFSSPGSHIPSWEKFRMQD